MAKKQAWHCLVSFAAARARKSDLIKIIYHTVVQTYGHAPINPEKPTALLAASTGVAAINIDGTTINTPLAITRNKGDVLPAINVYVSRSK